MLLSLLQVYVYCTYSIYDKLITGGYLFEWQCYLLSFQFLLNICSVVQCSLAWRCKLGMVFIMLLLLQ